MTDMSEQVTTTSFEACLEALGHIERRRLLVALLHDTSGGDRTVAIDRLVADGGDGNAELSMSHVHLPKLEAMGLVAWDRDAHTVSAGPAFEDVRPLLELLDEHDDELSAEWP